MLSIIAAVSRNNVIGINNTLPWHLPDDLKYFRSVTNSHAVIMGRKTFESIGRPLPNRHNIIVTRDVDWFVEGVTVVDSIEEAILAAGPVDEVFLIGGASLYSEALSYADRIYLTEIESDILGDAFFPEWSKKDFVEIKRDSRQGVDFDYSFVVYQRS
jgi:dihydrofolate reductase